jgi:hypothetical protein
MAAQPPPDVILIPQELQTGNLHTTSFPERALPQAAPNHRFRIFPGMKPIFSQPLISEVI